MVLTRAQRAQAKGDERPPESPLKSSILKAPARRGRAKKPDPEPEQHPPALKVSTRAAPKAAPATLKVSAFKASTTKEAASTRATGATRATASKATVNKPAATKKSATAKTEAKAMKVTKPVVPSRRVKKAEPESKDLTVEDPVQKPPVMETGGNKQDEMEMEDGAAPHVPNEVTDVEHAARKEQATLTASIMRSASKLPRLAAPSQPTSPFKTSFMTSAFKTSSILSPLRSLGSPRKPPVTGALLGSSPRTIHKSHHVEDAELGPPIRQAAPIALLSAPPQASHVAHPMDTKTSSPRRQSHVRQAPPTSVFSQSTTSPKRAATADITSVVSPPKRLKTAISMPSISSNSPARPSSSSTVSSTSLIKSSLRSPVKQTGLSPKKSVTFHHPNPPTPVPVAPLEKTPGILDGLVFFLDLNNLEGVNSNPLFAPLVEQLGGECVPEWTSNTMPISHVLFMNGELRTLEKVIASNGEVHCVNISWLLDCERENLRLPENESRYVVDLARIPGLQTPKPLKSVQNTPMVSRTPAAPPPEAPETPFRQPLGVSSGFVIKTPAFLASKATPAPPPSVGIGPIPEEDKENVSPETDNNSPLRLKTCPPKQLGKSLFSVDSLGSPLKNRLFFARRKSEEFAPKIGSPLRKGYAL